MAVLIRRRRGIPWLLVATLLTAGSVRASDADPRRARLAMAKAGLQACQIAQALPTARALNRADPAAQAIYRLAWLQALSPAGRGQAVAARFDGTATGGAWRWLWQGETWRDEQPPPGDPADCPGARHALQFARLPEPLRREILDPAVAHYAEVGPALRAGLRSYLLSERIAERMHPLPKLQLASGTTAVERCEWEALRFLHAPSSGVTAERLPPPFAYAACPELNGVLRAVYEAQRGDRLLAGGQADLAYALFESAARDIPGQDPPLALVYRLAVSGELAGKGDDLSLRALTLAMQTAVAHPDRALAPIYFGTLQTLACGKLAELAPHESSRLFHRVFGSGADLDRQADAYARLSEACDSRSLRALGGELIRAAVDRRIRARLAGLVLANALNQGDAAAIRSTVGELANVAGAYPALAHHRFWEAMSQAILASPASLRLATDAFRRVGAPHWGKSDELRWTARKNSEDHPPRVAGLATDSLRASRALAIPIGIRGPRIAWTDANSVDWVKLFGELE